MVCCPVSEIAFSQVREDPTIEGHLVNQLARQQAYPLRILLVASGGCTALSLLAETGIQKIVAVDANPAQLHLVELRYQALLHLALDEQLQFIGADPPSADAPHNRLHLYDLLRPHLPQTCRDFWDNRSKQIAFGVNRVGRFEELFRELAHKFSDLGLAPLEDPHTAIHHPQWSECFAQVFERQKLINTFGEAAVNYSMDRSFGDHFADVFTHALQRFNPQKNYFLTQVWADRYPPTDHPPYLQEQVQQQIRTGTANRLQLQLGNFADILTESANLNGFDLIQFSNISDWMPLSALHTMLHNAVRCLKPGGMLLGRRLNGDHHLANVMAEHLTVDRQLSQDLLHRDRSFFYREVVVGQR